jgi:hypothetical protein
LSGLTPALLDDEPGLAMLGWTFANRAFSLYPAPGRACSAFKEVVEADIKLQIARDSNHL